MIVLVMITALLTSCAGQTPSVQASKVPSAPVASADQTMPPAAADQTVSPKTNTTVQPAGEKTAIPPMPVATPKIPLSYSDSDGVKIWNFTDRKITKEDIMEAGALGLTLAAADGPIPVGDILALAIIAGIGTFFLVQNAQAITDAMRDTSLAISSWVAAAGPTTYTQGTTTLTYSMTKGESGCMHTFRLITPVNYLSGFFGSCGEEGKKGALENFINGLGKINESAGKLVEGMKSSILKPVPVAP